MLRNSFIWLLAVMLVMPVFPVSAATYVSYEMNVSGFEVDEQGNCVSHSNGQPCEFLYLDPRDGITPLSRDQGGVLYAKMYMTGRSTTVTQLISFRPIVIEVPDESPVPSAVPTPAVTPAVPPNPSADPVSTADPSASPAAPETTPSLLPPADPSAQPENTAIPTASPAASPPAGTLLQGKSGLEGYISSDDSGTYHFYPGPLNGSCVTYYIVNEKLNIRVYQDYAPYVSGLVCMNAETARTYIFRQIHQMIESRKPIQSIAPAPSAAPDSPSPAPSASVTPGNPTADPFNGADPAKQSDDPAADATPIPPIVTGGKPESAGTWKDAYEQVYVFSEILADEVKFAQLLDQFTASELRVIVPEKAVQKAEMLQSKLFTDIQVTVSKAVRSVSLEAAGIVREMKRSGAGRFNLSWASLKKGTELTLHAKDVSGQVIGTQAIRVTEKSATLDFGSAFAAAGTFSLYDLAKNETLFEQILNDYSMSDLWLAVPKNHILHIDSVNGKKVTNVTVITKGDTAQQVIVLRSDGKPYPAQNKGKNLFVREIPDVENGELFTVRVLDERGNILQEKLQFAD